MVNTKFWSDSWVREKLNPLDRYLFLYFLTNEHTNICGIYELHLDIIAFETGLDKHDLTKSLLPRLKPKVYYKDGWVIIPNFTKNQNQGSKLIQIGIGNELSKVPPKILEYAKGYKYPIQALSYLIKSNLIKSNVADTPLTDREIRRLVQ